MKALSSSGLGRQVFILETGVQFPLALPVDIISFMLILRDLVVVFFMLKMSWLVLYLVEKKIYVRRPLPKTFYIFNKSVK